MSELSDLITAVRRAAAELTLAASSADRAQRVAEIEEQEAVLDRQLDADFNSLAGEDEPIAEAGDRITTGNGNRYHEVTAVHTKRKPWCYMAGGVCRQTHEIADVYTRAEQATNDALVLIKIGDIGKAGFSHVMLSGVHSDGREAWAVLSADAVAALGEFTHLCEGECAQCDADEAAIRSEYADVIGLIKEAHARPEDPAYPGDAEPTDASEEEEREAAQRRECGKHQIAALGELTTYWCGLPEGHDGSCDTRKVSTESLYPETPARPWTEWDLITAGDGEVRVHEGNRWYPIRGGEVMTGRTDDEIAALGDVRRAVVVTLPNKLRPDVITEVVYEYADEARNELIDRIPIGTEIKITGAARLTYRDIAANLLAAEVGGERR